MSSRTTLVLGAVGALTVPALLWLDVYLAMGFGGWINDQNGDSMSDESGYMMGIFGFMVIIAAEAFAGWALFTAATGAKR